jgi:hypothetical protein
MGVYADLKLDGFDRREYVKYFPEELGAKYIVEKHTYEAFLHLDLTQYLDREVGILGSKDKVKVELIEDYDPIHYPNSMYNCMVVSQGAGTARKARRL